MENIPVEITHSLRFLSDFIHTINDLYKDMENTFHRLNRINNDIHYNKNVRKISNKARERADNALKPLIIDYRLFTKEITHLISFRESEEVVYSLHNYASLLKDYIRLEKDIDILLRNINYKKSIAVMENRYVILLGYNKIINPLNKSKELLGNVTKNLKKILNEK